MPININDIENSLIKPALKKLIRKDIRLIEKELKEECINHKLAIYLSNFLRSIDHGVRYDIDLEYNKKIDGDKEVSICGKIINIRPDILIHQRGFHNNLLVIEAKKDYPSPHDKNKIKGLMCNENYNYTFGCLISYHPKKKYLAYHLLSKEGNTIIDHSIKHILKVERRNNSTQRRNLDPRRREAHHEDCPPP
jgi:hypothetical protein